MLQMLNMLHWRPWIDQDGICSLYNNYIKYNMSHILMLEYGPFVSSYKYLLKQSSTHLFFTSKWFKMHNLFHVSLWEESS